MKALDKLLGGQQNLIGIVLLALLILVVFPLTLDAFRLNMVGKYLTYAFVAVGLVLCWGYGGILSLGQGVFFGGTEPTWSNRTLRQVLRQHGAAASSIAWIDLHTGLGPSGHGERIYAGNDDAVAVARARAWWDGGGATPVTSIYDGSSTSAFLTGLMWTSIYDECPHAEYTGIAMEYGTVPVLDVMNAIRAEQWLNLHPETPADKAAQIKAQMLAAFYTDTDVWKGQIISQARQSMFQAVDGLAV